MPAAPSASTPIVVTMGNPNTGKSTLFNRLTGLKQKVSNYPGVTVEQVEGSAHIEDFDVRLVDVPGTYSLAAMSPDEIIAVDVLQGAVDGLDKPQAVIVVVDASNLRRNLFLASQVLEAGIPTVLALNMIDRLPSLGIGVDADRLAQLVGVPVVPLSAAKGTGLDSLKRALAEVIRVPRVSSIVVNPTIRAAAAALVERLPQAAPVSLLTCERALIDEGGFAEQRLARQYGDGVIDDLHDARRRAGNGRSLSAIEARNRYSWIQSLLKDVETRRGQAGGGLASTADKILNHPVAGTLLFVLVMALLFQTVFAWAAPMVDAIDYLTGRLGMAVAAVLGPGLITSFVTDGIIAGVGSVIVFLPTDPDLICLHHRAGGLRLHGAGGVLDGPSDARPRLVRAILHPDAVEFCLCRARNHGRAGDRESQRPPRYDHRGAFHDLLRAAAGLLVVDCGFRS